MQNISSKPTSSIWFKVWWGVYVLVISTLLVTSIFKLYIPTVPVVVNFGALVIFLILIGGLVLYGSSMKFSKALVAYLLNLFILFGWVAAFFSGGFKGEQGTMPAILGFYAFLLVNLILFILLVFDQKTRKAALISVPIFVVVLVFSSFMEFKQGAMCVYSQNQETTGDAIFYEPISKNDLIGLLNEYDLNLTQVRLGDSQTGEVIDVQITTALAGIPVSAIPQDTLTDEKVQINRYIFGSKRMASEETVTRLVQAYDNNQPVIWAVGFGRTMRSKVDQFFYDYDYQQSRLGFVGQGEIRYSAFNEYELSDIKQPQPGEYAKLRQAECFEQFWDK